jgi:hypothetical protein
LFLTLGVYNNNEKESFMGERLEQPDELHIPSDVPSMLHAQRQEVPEGELSEGSSPDSAVRRVDDPRPERWDEKVERDLEEIQE